MPSLSYFETTSFDAFSNVLKLAIEQGLKFNSEFDTELELYIIRFEG